MNDDATSTVILPALSKVEGSERSLPAVAGESKDLYPPQLPRLPAEARGLRSRPLWSAAVRAALHSCRLSMPLGHSGSGVTALVRWSPYAISDSSASTVILPALSEVEGSERSLPAVAGLGRPIPCLPSTMSDPSTNTVILSERSESKDLYLPQLPRLPADVRGLRSRPLWSAVPCSRPGRFYGTVRAALHSLRLSTQLRNSGPGVAASVRRSPHAMSDSSASAVILSERSESKDLYLPRLAPPSPNQDSRWGASIPYSLFSN